jgi:hypothetical protein
VQGCRRKGYYNIGFMDPDVINENNVIKWPNRTKNNIFSAMDKQHTCTFILLLYNFKRDLQLFFHPLNLIINISYISSVYVYQQILLDLAQYRD